MRCREVHGRAEGGVAVPGVVHLHDLGRRGDVETWTVVRLAERAMLDYLGWAGVPPVVVRRLRVAGCRVELCRPVLQPGAMWVRLALESAGRRSFLTSFDVVSEDGAPPHAAGEMSFDLDSALDGLLKHLEPLRRRTTTSRSSRGSHSAGGDGVVVTPRRTR